MCIKNYTRNSLIAGMVLLASACYKDNQKFEYDQINDVRLETPGTSYTVAALDSLIIAPTLVETMPSGETYTYVWTIGSSAADAKTVSANKDLRLKVELAPGIYTVTVKATSTKTGISALARYTVTVNGAYYGGWYVVNNKDGKAQVSLIRTDEIIFTNPMETTNKKTYPGRALGVYHYGTSTSSGILTVFTDQGVYRFNMNDWLELSNTATTVPALSGNLPFTASPIFGYAAFDQYIIAEGGIYAGLGYTFYPGDVTKPFSDRISGDYNMFPGVFAGNLYTTLFYDTKSMKFMQLGYLERDIVNAPATPSGTFNMANVGKKMIAYDMGVNNSQSAEYYYVMESSAGRFLLSTTSTATATTSGIYQQMLNSPEIGNATQFATSTLLKQMYYTVGNKIYLYDILANSASLIYTFPSGYVIKDIEMLRNTSKKLVVGTNNGSVGEVYYFEIDGLGRFVNNTYAKKFGGFGEITQVAAARGKSEQ